MYKTCLQGTHAEYVISEGKLKRQTKGVTSEFKILAISALPHFFIGYFIMTWCSCTT